MAGNQRVSWGEQAKRLIDGTTTYRLMLYYLLILFVAALVLGAQSVLPYAPAALIWSLALLLVAASFSNKLLAWIFGAVTNTESVYITTFILVLTLSPAAFTDLRGAAVLAVVAIIAMTSKYLLAVKRKHIFNPAALALVVSAAVFNAPAAWWVAGNFVLLPLILGGGLIMVYKLRRSDLVIAFAVAVLVATLLVSNDPVASLQATLAYSAVFFFAFVMLTEPSTMPSRRIPRVMYGAFVGTFFVLAPTVGTLHFSPEITLLFANLFAWAVNPVGRYALTFVERHPLANGMFEYLFRSDRPLRFLPGQYLEWTLAGVAPDSRGNRHYFSNATALEDPKLVLVVGFHAKRSALQTALGKRTSL